MHSEYLKKNQYVKNKKRKNKKKTNFQEFIQLSEIENNVNNGSKK
jgi:hypothetical protein